jgi:hypothetical protein
MTRSTLRTFSALVLALSLLAAPLAVAAPAAGTDAAGSFWSAPLTLLHELARVIFGADGNTAGTTRGTSGGTSSSDAGGDMDPNG